MGMGGIEKVLEYLTTHLQATFNHSHKTMEDCEMLSFLHGVLQVHLEFWNSGGPFEEYVLDFMKPSRCVQDECVHMITGSVSSHTHQKLLISIQYQHGGKDGWTSETEHRLDVYFRQIFQH